MFNAVLLLRVPRRSQYGETVNPDAAEELGESSRLLYPKILRRESTKIA